MTRRGKKPFQKKSTGRKKGGKPPARGEAKAGGISGALRGCYAAPLSPQERTVAVAIRSSRALGLGLPPVSELCETIGETERRVESLLASIIAKGRVNNVNFLLPETADRQNILFEPPKPPPGMVRSQNGMLLDAARYGGRIAYWNEYQARRKKLFEEYSA